MAESDPSNELGRPAAPPGLCILCEPIDSLQYPLFPGEETLVNRAVDKRRREFTAGRTLARRALRLSNLPQEPILQDDRAPRWPPSVSGSISHCATHCAVAVAPVTTFRSIGLDLETIGLVHQDLWSHVFTPAERRTLLDLPADRQAFSATAGFAAKEAFYKLQFPLTRQWVNFEDVTVTLDSPEQFTLSCNVDLPAIPGFMEGSILRPHPTLALCLLWLPA